MAYAIDKRIVRTSESKADEVARIHKRWTLARVSACRYCGAPMILHDARYCTDTREQIEEEDDCGERD